MSKRAKLFWCLLLVINMTSSSLLAILNIPVIGVSRGEQYICAAIWTVGLVLFFIIDQKDDPRA